jgi:hypothetical protein
VREFGDPDMSAVSERATSSRSLFPVSASGRTQSLQLSELLS